MFYIRLALGHVDFQKGDGSVPYGLQGGGEAVAVEGEAPDDDVAFLHGGQYIVHVVVLDDATAVLAKPARQVALAVLDVLVV